MNIIPSKDNLFILEKKFPVLTEQMKKSFGRGSYSIRQSKTGFPGVILKSSDGSQTTIHSCYDPQKEAQKLIKSLLKKPEINYVIFGLGLGYHVQELIKKIPLKSKIFVIEKDRELFEMAMQNNDLKDILSHPGVYFSIGENPETLIHFPEEIKYDFAINGFTKFKFPSLYKKHKDYYQKYESNFEKIIQNTKIEINTQEAFSKLFFNNEIANLEVTMSTIGIKEFKNFAHGIPGIIISAGPSLDKNISLLKNAKSKSLLFSVPTALKFLIKNGIIPDFVVAIDPNEISINSFDFESIPHNVTLIFNPTIPPLIIERFSGKKIVIESTTNFNQWVVNLIGSKGSVGANQSVAHFGASIGNYFGCSPLVLVGQDLAFEKTRLHCSDSHYHETYKMDCTQTRTMSFFIKQRFKENLSSMKPARNIFGNLSTTTQALDSFRNIFSKDIAQNSLLLNATEGGISIPNIPNVSLKEILFQFPNKKLESNNFKIVNKPLNHKVIEKVRVALRGELNSYFHLLDLINNIFLKIDENSATNDRKHLFSNEIQNFWIYLKNKPDLFLFLQNILVEIFLKWNRESYQIALLEYSEPMEEIKEKIFERDMEFIQTLQKEIKVLIKTFKEKNEKLSNKIPVKV